MPAIPFPQSSAPGVRPQDGAGRLINAYCEVTPSTPPRPVWRRVPGLAQRLLIDAHSHCRGMMMGPSDTLMIALDNRLYSVTKSGTVYTAGNRGVLNGTDLVTMARNNKAGTPDMVVVTADGAFNMTVGGAPTSFADADLPQPNSVVFFKGYFIFTSRDGRLFSTGLNAVTVDALAFQRTDFRSDDLLRAVAFGDMLFAFGTASCEVYRDVGSSPFPLAFTTAIPRGLLAPFAVAGFEEGWASALIWAADDGVIYRLNGSTPERISTPAVERAIEALADKSTLAASVYMASGHPVWCLSSPSWTWCYDVSTGWWHERKSYGFDRWRASCSVRAWGEWLAGDNTTGALYAVTEASQGEHTSPLVWTIESDRVTAFPGRIATPRTDFMFSTGVGIAPGSAPMQTAPRVSVSYSNDGGFVWSDPVLRELGPQGTPQQRVMMTRTGIAGPNGKRWRVSGSDAVPVSFHGAEMAAQPRAE